MLRREPLGCTERKTRDRTPVLRDAVRAATHFTLERDVRILIDHDTKVWESLGHKNLEEYYQYETGEKIAPYIA